MKNYNKPETLSENKEYDDDLAQSIDETTDAPTHKTVRVVNCERLNVRKEPNKKADILCVVKKGDVLSLNIEKNKDVAPGWLYIRADADITGYVMGEFVEEV